MWGSAGSGRIRSFGSKTFSVKSGFALLVCSTSKRTVVTPTSSPVCDLPGFAYLSVVLSAPFLFGSYGEGGMFPPIV